MAMAPREQDLSPWNNWPFLKVTEHPNLLGVEPRKRWESRYANANLCIPFHPKLSGTLGK